jgi:hypothetical protein
MADRTPAQEIQAAAEKLRASMTLPPIAGEVEESSIETLNFLVSLLKAREPLAKWLESWDGIEISEDGPWSDDAHDALAIARAINGAAS